ncbi:hypothetical protein ACFXOD_11655 [Streptomyces sp. NPDC059161]|uniref:hypothetical protein n=1 Tax=Streptomyces sp. NPDC059161 TaxID=3346749 RepID=UPI0036CDBD20
MTAPSSRPGLDSRYCGAQRKQQPGPCTRPAGWGTSHPGTGRCKLHGGSTPNQKTSAARQRAEAEARAVLAELGVAPVDDPLKQLLALAGQVLAWQRATAELVNRLESVRYQSDGGSEQIRAEVLLYERAMDRAVAVLTAIARLNIEERLAAVAGRQVDAVVGAVEAALASAGVRGEDAIQAKRVAARHLRALDPAPSVEGV